jgi:hypothetical protein
MTNRCCASPRCTQPPVGFSTLCENHKRNLRRHGHAEQKGITVFELEPFKDRVKARRAKNPSNATWRLLDGRWEALTDHARVTLDAYASGRAALSHERQTAEILKALGETVEASKVVDTVLAMFAYWDQRPSRFKSDRAFDVQLARRVRGLGDTSTGKNVNIKSGKAKRTYTEVPPRVHACLAASLKVAFGAAGLRFAELEKRDAIGAHTERQELQIALRGLE